MDSRRDSRTTWRTSPDTIAPPACRDSQIGMTMWFDTMVESAMEATITMDVAEENPPRKDSSARPLRPSASGSDSTKRSGFSSAGIRSSPTTAIGTTNRLIAIRYSGKAQEAVRRCRSSSFSTTMTWNMRGRQSSAAADSAVSASQRSGATDQVPSGEASIRSSVAPTPPPMPQTTKTPTATSANSLTTASTATAMTTP